VANEYRAKFARLRQWLPPRLRTGGIVPTEN